MDFFSKSRFRNSEHLPEPCTELDVAHSHQRVAYLSPDFVVRVAEDVWRLRRRIDRATRTTGETALKGIRDSVIRLEDTLRSNHIQIQDHYGQLYHEGLTLEIVHVEGNPGPDDTLWVSETVKPTVRFGDRILSPGQVILTNKPLEGD